MIEPDTVPLNRINQIVDSKPVATMATTFQPRPVYESLKDLQPVLGDLYIGNNKEFEQLICPNCKLIAVNPSDCANCSEQICIFCQESAATTGDG